MTESVEAVVVGAGVVGLAAARSLAMAGRETLILETSDTIGSEISSRNSEVIHAGIYYPTGSLKARLCVAGRDQLYAYCEAHGVANKRIGKLIVATDESQIATLHKIRTQAEANGVGNLEFIGANAVHELEPALRAAGALMSPSTGIVDSHALMLSYLGDVEAHGGVIAYRSPLSGGRIEGDGFLLDIGGSAPMQLRCRYLVNAAGLGARKVALSMAGLNPALVPPLNYAKGNYFVLAGPSPFRRLIYPVPEHGGLGVHLTLDLSGAARFGPDVEWIDTLDYRVDPLGAKKFYAAIRQYWPGLEDGKLAPGYAGIRPKISGPKDPAADFVVQGPQTHRNPRLVNLFGIESPGLTASLAIADLVSAQLAH